MSIITRIRNVFSKAKSTDLIGIALRQQSISYFVRKANESKGETFENKGNSIVKALKALVSVKPLPGQYHLVLAHAHSQIVQVDKPNVPAAEINAALKWQIKDLVSIAPENMMLDYFDGPTLAGGHEKINVVCTAKNDLMALVSIFNDTQLNINSITTEEFAFASLLPLQPDAVLFVCQQPSEEINLLIVKNGQLFFSRRLRGFAQMANKSEDELTMGIIDSLSLEIQRSTDYFERQLKQAPIKTIEILLPVAQEAFLARKLAENTNVEVKLFAMPETLESLRGSAVAIGATQLNFMEPN
ncbi:MSHA biogenesis protein MshI [Colwellia sp. MB02u-6]|jgi:MSHA biogenesis protein MshI|uniref:MSHA biogenesis protein MshI n=1 Tax=Colwellia sp. MB02u-6 TaxID=2759824 RepID=UPI0015F52A7C|nr:MSHA biogenesis protein MshI [Colwellia sp. MB02u-6]MBA6329100.1 MSHA biogenesis protein MshI [Colwellia sp. MB02u-6]